RTGRSRRCAVPRPAPAPGPPGPAPYPALPHSCRLLLPSSFQRRIGGRDHRAAEAALAIVEDQRLARGHRALGTVEAHAQATIAGHFDAARFGLLPVAHLRGAFESGGRRRAFDPVRGPGPGGGGLQPWTVVPLVHVQDVRRHVLADHVPGRLRPAAYAAQLQPAALAQGEVRNPGVGAEHALLRVADLARARREVVRQEFAEIAFADEADAGRVLFLRGGQAGLGGDRPDLALGQVAER